MHTTSYISNYIKGELLGADNIDIKGVCSLNRGKPGFISFANSSATKESLTNSKASAIIVSKNTDFVINNIAIIKVDNPVKSFIDILNLFNSNLNSYKPIKNNNYVLGKNVKIGKNVRIGDNSIISDNVIIKDNISIGSCCFIGNCVEIKSETFIDSNVTIYDDVKICKKTKISSGAIIGGQGFGFIKDENNKILEFPHIGNVIIHDNVSIGANTCIDRGTIDCTIIGENTKIDNLVQIAHNVCIGKNCIIAAQTGVAGSSVIGDNVTIAGQVGVVGHISITNNVTIASKSTVMKSITKSGVYSGTPAIKHGKNKRLYVIMSRLPDIYKKLKNI